MKRILIVLTNIETYQPTSEQTGLWISELTEFVNEFNDTDFQIDYVSPKGGEISIDPSSLDMLSPKDLKLFQNKFFENYAIKETLEPSDINCDEYDAIYFTGGHGAMWDFPNNKQLHYIAQKIYGNKGYITSVCHGIAGILNVKDSNGEYLIKGKKITGFTDAEERLADKNDKVPFSNEKIAHKHGANFIAAEPFTSNVVKSKFLITGQNPQSTKAVAVELKQSLLLKD